jgi:hypothetical protein
MPNKSPDAVGVVEKKELILIEPTPTPRSTELAFERANGAKTEEIGL